MNDSLAIAIPSFNRVDILERNLSEIICQAKEYSVNIYISDDSDDREVQQLIHTLSTQYENLFIFNNDPRLGHDKNFLTALSLPVAGYVWVLGDSVSIKQNAIKKLLKIISKYQPNIIGVNADNRRINYKNAIYTDPKTVFNQFAWHLTYTGTTIFSRKAIDEIKKFNISKFRNFPQIALIFHCLANQCSFYWVNDDLVFGNRSKESYWYKTVFRTFITDWEEAVQNLPNVYHPDLKQKVILEHSEKSGLFSFRSLLKMRYLGVFNKTILNKYKLLLIAHSGNYHFFIYIIAIMPLWMIKIALKISKVIRK